MLKSWYQWKNATPGPLGAPRGAKQGSDPSRWKNQVFDNIFGGIFLIFSRIIRDINTKSHNSKKLGFDPFLVHFWTKNCKKRANFHEAQQFWLWMNFLFYCKNQLFQTLFMTSFFFKFENRDSEVSQTKNFRVRHPLILPIEKKKSARVEFEPTPLYATSYYQALYQLSHQDCLT